MEGVKITASGFGDLLSEDNDEHVGQARKSMFGVAALVTGWPLQVVIRG